MLDTFRTNSAAAKDIEWPILYLGLQMTATARQGLGIFSLPSPLQFCMAHLHILHYFFLSSPLKLFSFPLFLFDFFPYLSDQINSSECFLPTKFQIELEREGPIQVGQSSYVSLY